MADTKVKPIPFRELPMRERISRVLFHLGRLQKRPGIPMASTYEIAEAIRVGRSDVAPVIQYLLNNNVIRFAGSIGVGSESAPAYQVI